MHFDQGMSRIDVAEALNRNLGWVRQANIQAPSRRAGWVGGWGSREHGGAGGGGGGQYGVCKGAGVRRAQGGPGGPGGARGRGRVRGQEAGSRMQGCIGIQQERP